MIPQEVADIIAILRDEIIFDDEDEQFVLDLAYRIYNKIVVPSSSGKATA